MKTKVLTLAIFATALTIGPVLASEESDLKTFCKPDVEKFCKGIPMGGGKLLECLKAHGKEISVGCAQALQKLKG